MDKIPLAMEPSMPSDLDNAQIVNIIEKYIENRGLKSPECLLLSGSRVWELSWEKSDIDVLAIGDYREETDYFIQKGRLEIELSVISLSRVLKRKIPMPLRWDILASVPLRCSRDLYNKIRRSTLLTDEEKICCLYYIVTRLSWIGLLWTREVRSGLILYEGLERLKRNFMANETLRANTLQIVNYALDKIATALYAIRGLPIPFAKWRIAHLDKIANIPSSIVERIIDVINESQGDFGRVEKVSELFIDLVDRLEREDLLSKIIDRSDRCETLYLDGFKCFD